MKSPQSVGLTVLKEIDAFYAGLTEQDRTTPWVAVSPPHLNGEWSVGPDHEMGHRAELAGWCEDEAKLLAALVNAWPKLRNVVKAAEELVGAYYERPAYYTGPLREALKEVIGSD